MYVLLYIYIVYIVYIVSIMYMYIYIVYEVFRVYIYYIYIDIQLYIGLWKHEHTSSRCFASGEPSDCSIAGLLIDPTKHC